MQFSIAIPVYRQANFLPSALESIRAQAHDVQLAVMDATPDGRVQKVLENYRDLISYHRHGPDAGQASAIQEGWDQTDGEIVAWLCADDYFFPDTLDAVKQAFIRHPDVDVVYGDSVFVDEQGRFIGYFPEFDRDISSILNGCCISQPSCFVRRKALTEIGPLNPDFHYIMDWDLWTRLYQSGVKFHHLNQPLSVVRIHAGTKTSSRSWRRFSEIAGQLWRNTTPFYTAKSLIGFYHYDLLTCRVNNFEKLLLKGIDFYHHLKRRFPKRQRHKSRFRYGLSAYGNEVNGQATVLLPWYNQHPPGSIRIQCDLDSAPECYLNGLRLSSSPGSNFTYQIPACGISSRQLHLQLAAATNQAWHLYTVEFEERKDGNASWEFVRPPEEVTRIANDEPL